VDALAQDPIQKPPYGRNHRIQRGLYRNTVGIPISADVNSALNYARNLVIP
jgi:hypothetical protein